MKSYSIILCIAAFLSSSIIYAQEATATNGKFVNVNGCKIYYEETGQGEPLLLLHGFGQTASYWRTFTPEFSKKYRVIAWDMRGHGRSTNPDTTIAFLHANVARDLLAFIDALHLDKVKAIGLSSGAITLLYASSMKPEKFDAIVPVAGQIYYSNQVRDFISRNSAPEWSYKFFNYETTHGKVKGTLLARQFYNFRMLTGDPSITPYDLSQIKARTLIVHGDNDFVPVSQAWEMYQNIPNARLWISPNGWHVPIEGPNMADFISRTSEFLNGDWNKSNFPK
ncbi:MAG: alpha/beta hydrolase [Chryseolinea sp.]